MSHRKRSAVEEDLQLKGNGSSIGTDMDWTDFIK